MKKQTDSHNPFGDVVSSMAPTFRKFEEFLVAQVSTFSPEIRDAAKFAIIPKGKYIRPTLVMSAAAESAGLDTVVRRSAVVELAHLSTLIHDDVIDNASVRRSLPTANSRYGARTAILLGDVIFSHVMVMAVEDPDRRVIEEVSKCMRVICEGEIRQTLSDKTDLVSRARYYDMVYGKTGALFELSCRLGAMAVGSRGWESAAAEAGKELGIAYQIYDDVCDWFMSEAQAGKTLGTDLVSGKQTFPLIIMLERLSKDKAREFVKNLPSSDFLEIRRRMFEEGVLGECSSEILNRIALAEAALEKFPNLNARLLDCCAALRRMDGMCNRSQL